MLQIYKASAGSGKTYTLTREYIKYLIATKHNDGRYRLRRKPETEHSHILAITFTNKATKEMTRRIIKELAMLAGMPTSEELKRLGLKPEEAYRTTLMSDYAHDFLDPATGLGCTVEELREASRRALISLLYNYSYFNVSTIDSFFQSVLRMFTREVELPDNYNVELNSRFAVSLGVDEMFNTLNYHTIPGTPEDVEQRWISDWLYQFMYTNMVNGNTFNMFSRSSHLYDKLIKELDETSNEDFKRRLDILRPYYSQRTNIVKFTNELTELYNSGRKEVIEKASQLIKSQPSEAFNRNFYNALKKLINNEPLSSTKSIVKVSDDGNAAVTKRSIKEYNLSSSFLDQCREFAEDFIKFERIATEFKPILKQVYLFGLLSTVMTHIDAYCRDNSMILLSDTNNILKGLINDDETPFIYERLGYYLNHFLIDEFQDTSPMQWDNLRPLLMESLSRGNDDLIIGDEKQCIYRFRNSDPQLLGEKVETDTVSRFNTKEIVDIKGIDITDNCNWRSAVEIVKFNNTLFKVLSKIIDNRISQQPGVLSASETYSNVIQQINDSRTDKHGYVKIHFEQQKSRKDKEENNDTPTPSSDELSLAFMTEELRRQLTSGYRPNDIAILVRNHEDGQKVIKHLLKAINDPENTLPHFDIVSEDALRLSSNKSIRLIISILRLVSLPEFLEVDDKAAAQAEGTPTPERIQSDAYRRARLINRYQFYLHRTDPDGRPYSPSEALHAALVDNRTRTIEGNGNDDSLRSVLDMDCLNLPAVTERIIHTFVPDKLKENDNLFLSTFQDLVYDYSQRGTHDIKGFLDWWDRSGCKTCITSPSAGNALTVMTVHKSKGLEYPCVHIPFADGEMFKNGTNAWVDLDTKRFEAFGIDPALVPPAMPLSITTSMTGSVIYGDSCLKVIAQSVVDELNVNYVALTRPTTELIIYVPYKTKESFGNYVRECLETATAEYINDLNLPEDGKKWIIPLSPHFNGTEFILGEPTRAAVSKKEERTDSDEITLNKYTTSNMADRIRACTRLDTIDPFDVNDQRDIGSFLHAVMSGVTHKTDLSRAMRRQTYRYHLEEHIASRLGRRLELALSNPEANRWFEGFDRVITERTITSRGDTRRPDRIVWLPDGSIEVIDYKFVDRLPSQITNNSTHHKYVRQVGQYCRDVKGNTHTDVKGYIWYISENDNIIISI